MCEEKIFWLQSMYNAIICVNQSFVVKHSGASCLTLSFNLSNLKMKSSTAKVVSSLRDLTNHLFLDMNPWLNGNLLLKIIIYCTNPKGLKRFCHCFSFNCLKYWKNSGHAQGFSNLITQTVLAWSISSDYCNYIELELFGWPSFFPWIIKNTIKKKASPNSFQRHL